MRSLQDILNAEQAEYRQARQTLKQAREYTDKQTRQHIANCAAWYRDRARTLRAIRKSHDKV